MTTTPPRNDDAETGRLAGFGAGMVAGAQLGTVLIPIPLVGTFTGALVGGALGGKIGQQVGPTVLGAVNSVVETVTGTVKEVAQGVSTPSATSVPISREEEATASGDILAQLERLGKLRSQGLLTEEEFAAAKAKLLK